MRVFYVMSTKFCLSRGPNRSSRTNLSKPSMHGSPLRLCSTPARRQLNASSTRACWIVLPGWLLLMMFAGAGLREMAAQP